MVNTFQKNIIYFVVILIGSLLLTVGAVATTALVGIIGVAASADVLRKKPLATLRAE